MVFDRRRPLAAGGFEPVPAIRGFRAAPNELERQLDAVTKRRGVRRPTPSRHAIDPASTTRRARRSSASVKTRCRRADVDAHLAVAGRHVRAVHLECRLDDVDVASNVGRLDGRRAAARRDVPSRRAPRGRVRSASAIATRRPSRSRHACDNFTMARMRRPGKVVAMRSLAIALAACPSGRLAAAGRVSVTAGHAEFEGLQVEGLSGLGAARRRKWRSHGFEPRAFAASRRPARSRRFAARLRGPCASRATSWLRARPPCGLAGLARRAGHALHGAPLAGRQAAARLRHVRDRRRPRPARRAISRAHAGAQTRASRDSTSRGSPSSRSPGSPCPRTSPLSGTRRRRLPREQARAMRSRRPAPTCDRDARLLRRGGHARRREARRHAHASKRPADATSRLAGARRADAGRRPGLQRPGVPGFRRRTAPTLDFAGAPGHRKPCASMPTAFTLDHAGVLRAGGTATLDFAGDTLLPTATRPHRVARRSRVRCRPTCSPS